MSVRRRVQRPSLKRPGLASGPCGLKSNKGGGERLPGSCKPWSRNSSKKGIAQASRGLMRESGE